MQWSPAANAGFSPPETPHLWLPLAPDYGEVNVERELADPRSILCLYRRLLAYRRASPALQWGSYRPLDGTPEDCYVFVRQAGGQRVLIALNFSAQERRLAPPDLGQGRIELSTQLDRDGPADLGDIVLRGHEGLIMIPEKDPSHED
jgi:alpha-glucosidase